jgi:hypothetical protein
LVMRCVEIIVVEMLLVPNICIHSPKMQNQTLLQTPNYLLAASAIGQQQTTGFCDTKKGVIFSTTSSYQDKVNSSWRKSDIHKAVTSKGTQHSRFCPSQSLPKSVSPTSITANVTGANQTPHRKISQRTFIYKQKAY